MKQPFKWLVATTAFVAAGAASAQGFPPVLTSATGTLALSSDASAAIAVIGSSISTPATPPVIDGVPSGGVANAASYASSTKVLTVGFPSLTFTGNAVTGLSSPDAFVRWSRGIVNEDGEHVGNLRVYLAGFEVDLAQSIVYANVFSTDLSGAVTTFGKTALFQATLPGIVGGTQGNIVVTGVDQGGVWYAASGSLAGELRMTTQAADIILTSLGIEIGNPNSAVGSLWRNADWGTFSFAAPAVPEPSTCAMFGIGLLAIGVLARRQAKA